MPLRHGIGYGLRRRELPLVRRSGPASGAAGEGRWCINDLDAGMTVAYVMNRMGEGTVGDDRGFRLLAAVYGALGA